MDQNNCEFNCTSKEEAHSVMEDEAAAGEASSSFAAHANEDAAKETAASALGGDTVVDHNIIDTMKTPSVCDSGLDVFDGDSLVKDDVPNGIKEFSLGDTPEEKACGSDEKLETSLQEHVENIEDSETDIIENVDNLNFDEFKANAFKTSNDLETICAPDCQTVSEDGGQPGREGMVSSSDDIVSLCSESNINAPPTEHEDNVKDAADVLKIVENCKDGHLQTILDIENEDVNNIKDDVNGNKILSSNDEHGENIIHQFVETLNAACIDKLQPVRNNCEQVLVPLKVVEDKMISLSQEESKNSQATAHPLECEDNALANDVEGVQGEEVLPPKDKDDIKHKHSDSEEAEESQTTHRSYKARVARLPLGFRRDDLKLFFSQFGEVLKVFDEGRHWANILFADEESYKKAICAREPFFDDHKLLIHSMNETIAVISGISRNIPPKDVEKAIKEILEEADAAPCRIFVPLSDPAEEFVLVQGHAIIAFNDLQTLQKAEEREKIEPFVISDKVVKLHLSSNEFYEKFCVRVFPIPSRQPRSILYHNLLSKFKPFGEIVAVMFQYVPKSAAYAGYILFELEESVKEAKEKGEIKIMDELVEIQDFWPFEQGQGFRHLWLKIHNLPPRITITEIKHHFCHDEGILSIELDWDYGSCFMHVNSEPTMQRCLRMHQTFLRGQCIAVMMTDEHPDRAFYREISRRRKPYFRGNLGRKKYVNNNSNLNGKLFTSATLPEGKWDQRGVERGNRNRKFSKSKSKNNHSEELDKIVERVGEGDKS